MKNEMEILLMDYLIRSTTQCQILATLRMNVFEMP